MKIALSAAFLDDKPYFASDTRWMAPDAFETRIFTKKSDVWSFACVVFEIYSDGLTPFSGDKIDFYVCKLVTFI